MFKELTKEQRLLGFNPWLSYTYEVKRRQAVAPNDAFAVLDIFYPVLGNYNVDIELEKFQLFTPCTSPLPLTVLTLKHTGIRSQKLINYWKECKIHLVGSITSKKLLSYLKLINIILRRYLKAIAKLKTEYVESLFLHYRREEHLHALFTILCSKCPELKECSSLSDSKPLPLPTTFVINTDGIITELQDYFNKMYEDMVSLQFNFISNMRKMILYRGIKYNLVCPEKLKAICIKSNNPINIDITNIEELYNNVSIVEYDIDESQNVLSFEDYKFSPNVKDLVECIMKFFSIPNKNLNLIYRPEKFMQNPKEYLNTVVKSEVNFNPYIKNQVSSIARYASNELSKSQKI